MAASNVDRKRAASSAASRVIHAVRGPPGLRTQDDNSVVFPNPGGAMTTTSCPGAAWSSRSSRWSRATNAAGSSGTVTLLCATRIRRHPHHLDHLLPSPGPPLGQLHPVAGLAPRNRTVRPA